MKTKDRAIFAFCPLFSFFSLVIDYPMLLKLDGAWHDLVINLSEAALVGPGISDKYVSSLSRSRCSALF